MKTLLNVLEDAEQAVRTNPRNALAWQSRGDALVRLNRFQEAVAAYKSALKIKPLQAEFLNGKGYALSRQAAVLLLSSRVTEAETLFQEAHTTLEAALKIDPMNIHYLANQADVLRNLGKTTAATALYDAIEKILLEAELTQCEEQLKIFPPLSPPVYAECLNQKGELLLQLYQPQEALSAFEAALQIESDNVLYQANRQRASATIIGREEKTLRTKTAERLIPATLGTINSTELKETEQSTEQTSVMSRSLAPPLNVSAGKREIIEEKASVVGIILKKGSELLNQNRYEEALTWYETQLKTQPDHPHWLREKIRVLWLLYRYDAALAVANSALAIYPHEKELWRQKIAVLKRLNPDEKVVAGYDALLAIQPIVVDDLIDKAFFLSHSLRQTEAALRCYDEALTMEPKNTSALWMKAVTLHRRQRYAEARIVYDAVLAIDPQHAIALRYKAELMREMSIVSTSLSTAYSSLSVFANSQTSITAQSRSQPETSPAPSTPINLSPIQGKSS